MKHAAQDLRGSIVPLVTPFRDGELDEPALADLIEWQIESGTHGISVTGTTGEPSSLKLEERQRVIQIAVETVAGRVPVVVGTGTENHDQTHRLSAYAATSGATALLIVVPYYVRPSQEGLYRHFKAVADRVELPIILYNIPGRSAVNLEIGTVSRLRDNCPNIVGIKEANPDFGHITRLIGQLGRDFLVFSGIELLSFPVLAVGGAGYVSATGNVLPREVARIYDLASQEKWQEAQDLHYHLMPMNEALFFETNPVPAKTALGWMGRIDPSVRPPLAALSPENRDRLRAVLGSYGLLDD